MDPFDTMYAPQIAAAAARLQQAAAEIGLRAAQLTAASAGCEWDGAGARAFRHRAHATTVQLRQAAAGLDTAAAALRRHAVRVTDELAAEQARQAVVRERVVRKLGELTGSGR